MRVIGRALSVAFLIALMLTSLGAVPVQARTEAPAMPLGLLDQRVRDLVRVGDVDGLLGDAFVTRPAAVGPGGPGEYILELSGRSLVGEMAYREAQGWGPMSPSSQKSYVAALRATQADLRATLEAEGIRVLYDYQVVFNGLAVVADGGDLGILASLPGVRAIRPSHAVSLALDHSVPFILGDKSHDALGADGTGITIAVIDTGIDYTHAGLGGSGDPADYAANDPTVIEPGTFPTAKVIGGTDLVGEFYHAGCPPADEGIRCSRIPVPDPDPLDINGHGSHVSGIAAGVGTASVAPGVAPGASLVALKVFALGSSSSAVIAAAIELAVDPNRDGDISDAVDIINMSLGSPYGRDTEFLAVASNMAVEAGVIVVASAGNEDDLPYVTGAPAAASQAISVAAGNDPGVQVQLVSVDGSDGADGDYESLEAAFTPALADVGLRSGLTRFVGLACDLEDGSDPFAPGSLDGMIPLIARGACRFDEKISNVENASAVAAVIYNHIPGAGPIIMGGEPIVGIPGVMVGNLDGLAIQTSIVEGTTTLTLDPEKVKPIPRRVQDFTSRGPRFVDSALKPDITAPGGAIHSVRVGSGTLGVDLSGTSMSAPHVAGAAALLRQLHPDWSVAEIKAVLMNGAENASPDGVPYPVSRMGAGIVQVDVSAELESVVVPSSMSFGVEEWDRNGVQTFSVTLEVRNMDAAKKKFDVSSAFSFPTDDEGSVQLLHQKALTVKGHDTATLKFMVKVNFDSLMPEGIPTLEEYDGFLTLSERTVGGDVLRVPFHIIPIARADAGPDEDEVDLSEDGTLTLENRGIRGTLVDIYQFGVADPNEDLISEAMGMPNDPDDWFDMRHTGAHVFDVSFGRILEFAVTTHGSRNVANLMETDVLIDVDSDGIPDYLVLAIDFGVFLGTYPDGRMVSGVFALPSGLGFLQFFVSDDMNTATQTIPIVLDDLNFLGTVFDLPTIDADDPDFDYFAVTFDFETGAFDITGSASFNAINPTLDTAPNFLLVGAGDSATVDVMASEEGSLLLLYLNNEAGPAQSEVVDVKFGG